MHKALDEGYIDLMIENNLAENLKHDYDITRINDRYSILHSPQETLDMCYLGAKPYHVFPTIYSLCSEISLESSGVSPIQSNPNFDLFGQGVLIGFIDTGIHYPHPAFLNPDGSSRILSIWDQTIENGGIRSDIPFGSEYDNDMINLALTDPNPLSLVPSTDEIGHGTMLAGIAAGSLDESQNFRGAAPKTELVVVKLAQAKAFNRAVFRIPDNVICYPESNILIGIEYIKKVANQLKRPVVLCVGLGSSQGSHEGHSALTSYLDNLSVIPRTSVCVAAGNEGNKRRHYNGVIFNEESYKEIELRVGELDRQFSMEIWQNSPGRLDVKILSPNGEQTAVVPPQLRSCIEHNFIFSNSTVYINNIIVEEESGEQLILLRFSNAMSGIWKIQVFNTTNITSHFNAWLPSGNIITNNTFFLDSDPYTTITSPGNSNNSVTVTAYNQLNNGMLIASSRGFSANGTINPDIAAPGFMLKGPNLKDGYGSATGTGAAAAHTAGIMALILEWNVLKGHYTTISGRDINRLLIRGAVRDASMDYPNRTWGYGRLDLMGMFRSLV